MAVESTARWYDSTTLEIVQQVKSADGKKMVKATLNHARKRGFLPSITSIIKEVLASGPQLQDWIINQHLNACISFPFDRNISIETEVLEYKKMIMVKANEFKNKAADKGKELHGFVDEWARTRELPEHPIGRKICNQINSKLQSLGEVKTITTEQSVGSLECGFCGTPDIFVVMMDDGKFILDLKTTSLRSYTKPYESWKTQLGGYDILTGSGATLLQAVADRETGDVIFVEHEEPEKWNAHFQHLFECWCIQKGYNPREI